MKERTRKFLEQFTKFNNEDFRVSFADIFTEFIDVLNSLDLSDKTLLYITELFNKDMQLFFKDMEIKIKKLEQNGLDDLFDDELKQITTEYLNNLLKELIKKDYVSKQKVKDKIKELENIKSDENISGSDLPIEEFNKEVINILKELIE